MGWSPAQVNVIDEGLGESAANAEGHPGFQRLMAAVSPEQVGIILGIEMSRLARSSRDWHQLLEICAVFGSLMGDLDGVYDPRNYIHRLLWGLKGTMSEAELHVLKQRMLASRRAKGERGELATPLPMGYVRRLSGEISKDPDEQAQGVIGLVFDQFERLGTLNGVLKYLVQYQLRLPHRIVNGPQRGELEWRRPNRATLSNLLHHPIYAGAYVYGRRPTDPRRQQPGRPGTGRTVAKPEDYQVLLRDRLAAYTGWEQSTCNVEQLAQPPERLGSGPRRRVSAVRAVGMWTLWSTELPLPQTADPAQGPQSERVLQLVGRAIANRIGNPAQLVRAHLGRPTSAFSGVQRILAPIAKYYDPFKNCTHRDMKMAS